MIADQYSGGPVGIETISAAISESRDALEKLLSLTFTNGINSANTSRSHASEKRVEAPGDATTEVAGGYV